MFLNSDLSNTVTLNATERHKQTCIDTYRQTKRYIERRETHITDIQSDPVRH